MAITYPASVDDSFLWECLNGRPTNVRRLLDRGANVHATDKHGDTGLHLACEYGFPITISILIDAGADINAKDRIGRTPLMRACENDHVEIVAHLMAIDGGPKDADDSYYIRVFNNAVYQNAINTVELLIATGIDINECYGHHWPPVLEACICGYPDMVKILTDAGADLTPKTYCDDETCLMNACQNGNTDTVRVLLAAGADPHYVNKFGKTALSIAADGGHCDIVQLLLATILAQ